MCPVLCPDKEFLLIFHFDESHEHGETTVLLASQALAMSTCLCYVESAIGTWQAGTSHMIS